MGCCALAQSRIAHASMLRSGANLRVTGAITSTSPTYMPRSRQGQSYQPSPMHACTVATPVFQSQLNRSSPQWKPPVTGTAAVVWQISTRRMRTRPGRPRKVS